MRTLLKVRPIVLCPSERLLTPLLLRIVHSLAWYRFVGRILGKAIYESILVNVVFAGFFLAKWLGKQSFLDDLTSLDPELYQGLLFLKRYPGNPEELSLNFTIAIEGATTITPSVSNRADLTHRMRRVWRRKDDRPRPERIEHPCDS
jgi:hypothetical protein